MYEGKHVTFDTYRYQYSRDTQAGTPRVRRNNSLRWRPPLLTERHFRGQIKPAPPSAKGNFLARAPRGSWKAQWGFSWAVREWRCRLGTAWLTREAQGRFSPIRENWS